VIRYLWSDALAVFVLLFYLFDSTKDISMPSLYLMIGIGGCFAAPTAFILSKLISRKLIQNQSSFIDRTPPGGVWLFILVGVVVGLLFFIVEMIGGRTIASEIIVVCLSFLSALFIILGIYIFILERKHDKKIYIGVQGFVFRERKP
jgi:drug/metabolite transporter (DMT)-like permease